MESVLVVDDDRIVRHIVTNSLQSIANLQVFDAADGSIALELIRSVNPTVVLLDVYLPNHNGLELFTQIKALEPKTPVIFITADTSSETAIQAMSSGAFDYLSKPLNVEQLRKLVASAIQARKAMDQPVALSLSDGLPNVERFIGCSKQMIEVYKSIGRVAAQNIPVLIRGESGCGKELVARALYHNSNRSEKPYVAINCAALPDQLLESELFGHEKGAFTGAEKRRIGRFEQCDGGTIFLDEVGDMSVLTQGKVLRLLQQQRFERLGGNDEIQTNVRLIAATNRPLEEMIAEGAFREDLLYRLNGMTITLPPLRARREDIPMLLEYFLRRAKFDMNRPDLEGLSLEALELLCRYDWPGNIRQLQSVVRQSVLHAISTVIDVSSLPAFIVESPRSKREAFPVTHSTHREQDPPEKAEANPEPTTLEISSASEPTASRPSDIDFQFDLPEFIDDRFAQKSNNLYAETIAEIERRLISRVLQLTNGNQSRAAEVLGITRGKIRDRVASFGIQFERTVSLSSTDEEAAESTGSESSP